MGDIRPTLALKTIACMFSKANENMGFWELLGLSPFQGRFGSNPTLSLFQF